MVTTKKTIFITGASAGIGKAAAYKFAQNGYNLILSARRISLLEEIKKDIETKFSVKVFVGELDVRNFNEVDNFVRNLPDEFKQIDVLFNNAGLAKGLVKLYEDEVENWDVMIDTNIKGLLYVTKCVLPLMLERKKGHIINMGSIAGRNPYTKGAVYCATKHAELAITQSLRADLLGTNIKVSTVDPGMVETEFSIVRFNGDTQKAKDVYKGLKPLVAEDIADIVFWIASTPEHVCINEVVVTPTAQANAYYAYREE
ncbi:MAG TPA: SDR family NAD(P)-dependent oxidoreductase [Ignavibacteriales bacterium]|nr:SDR family NAD(P)-dependent oxidoreductase [Ignavibacteriales bacterium]HOL81944.1 SDR family NAD(P)-dependent oxidoreductase [Ignavibacteriales bacterium]HOM65932.1 SDR family NAD(P)-dependent oxidoreductase [Ignavibacteriales bacterium]HPD67463.1 SDR family NAD(P)-dependent oxidoreductase [Ignavibacteriales bacterium]HPP34081.1 SDR family NAD(P)-dependent oxidoreductase [Ignavibacteriales bacterium]